ncbi:UDP-2,4-diacetamido-2,4,6-trideoxy-beta-L-altropyranose hydrolase [Botryobacter ruber]|uniref:UDP-2,4-diacetamido-2,4, 6-trideoxy-beta-L-altropyranose hydrolase n=1 Tax=Botryobacter ruber TaxID=2171629 RepID=UPI000E0AF8F3|nr:UDP-2,4-diacetamido-2,4,6-trideoxy-beta-L-altropyranose hydrolase [Botryobacter ruber]
MTQRKSRIVFRADGNSRIGLGHVVRSLALAEVLQQDYLLIFAIQAPEASLLQKIKQTCPQVIILPETQAYESEASYLAENHLQPTDVVVLDGYHFDTAYQHTLKNHGCSLLCIDDIHSYPFVADAVVNMAGGVAPEAYQLAPYTRLYTGPAYALLREPFRNALKEHLHLPPQPLHLLVCLGGADPANHTLRLAQELAGLPYVAQLEIVIGSACLHREELREWSLEQKTVSLHQNLEAEAMCRLMQRCAIAVTSASGIAYEYCAVGGILFVLKTADNQAGFYQFLLEQELAFAYAQLPELLQKHAVPELFQQQVVRQRRYFNSGNTDRYRQLIQTLSLSARIRLREVTEQDMLLLYGWANDPEVRKHSFNPEPIPLEQHQQWFRYKLAIPESCLYIAEVDGLPMAHIRFELSSSSALLSYLIAPGFRGKGLGHVVLLKGIKFLQQQHPELKEVAGLVQPDNTASVRAFEKAGFNYAEPDPFYPQAYRFVLSLVK